MVPKVIAFFFLKMNGKFIPNWKMKPKEKSPTQDHAVKKIDLIDC